MLEDRFRVNGAAFEWFKSYFTDRMQTFQVGSETSGPHHVTCGVPQGSVLGPQEFIDYTEDIACLFETRETEYHLYADDIQTVAHAYPTDIVPAVDRLQQCIEAVRHWCIPRRLQLNPVKTEAIWFGTKAGLKKLNGADVNLHVANVTIFSRCPSFVILEFGWIANCQ